MSIHFLRSRGGGKRRGRGLLGGRRTSVNIYRNPFHWIGLVDPAPCHAISALSWNSRTARSNPCCGKKIVNVKLLNLPLWTTEIDHINDPWYLPKVPQSLWGPEACSSQSSQTLFVTGPNCVTYTDYEAEQATLDACSLASVRYQPTEGTAASCLLCSVKENERQFVLDITPDI